MATRKASPAQIAARKLFAARAKAGEFSRSSAKAKRVKKTRGVPVVSAAEAALHVAKKIKARLTRKKNPITASATTKRQMNPKSRSHKAATRNTKPREYEVQDKNIYWDWLRAATFPGTEKGLEDAKVYAKALARLNPNNSVRVVDV